MESLSNSPEIPLISIKKSSTEGNVSLSHGKSNPLTEIAIRSIQNVTPEERSTKANLLENVVHLNVKKDEGEVVRISVQIYDLARALHFEPDEIEKAIDEGQLEQMIEKSLKEREEVKENIKSHLTEYGLTPQEFQEIDEFYTKNQDLLPMLIGQPIVIRKGEEIEFLGTAPAARSLAYVPDGPRKGMYVLLKDKGIDEVGVGSVNRATLCICLDTGKKAIFRTAHREDIPPAEFEANRITSEHPKYFASGIPLEYIGDFRPRGRLKNQPKDHIPKLLAQPKVGFIMDYLEGGELLSHIYNVSGTQMTKSGKLTEQDQLRIACEYAKTIAKLHELGLVHFDQKPENIFMTLDMHVRTGDFGATVKEGTPIRFRGTAGYIDPWLYQLLVTGHEAPASFDYDIWSLGAVLADLTHGLCWYNWITQHLDEREEGIIIDLDSMEVEKGNLFPERDNPLHPDSIINRCLQEDPTLRPTAKEVADALIHVYDTNYGTGSFKESQRKTHE